jgi:hypothetical protein
VYGDQLRLSNVAVLLAFAVGAPSSADFGALLALPVAAAYHAIERIWLREYLAGHRRRACRIEEEGTPRTHDG